MDRVFLAVEALVKEHGSDKLKEEFKELLEHATNVIRGADWDNTAGVDNQEDGAYIWFIGNCSRDSWEYCNGAIDAPDEAEDEDEADESDEETA